MMRVGFLATNFNKPLRGFANLLVIVATLKLSRDLTFTSSDHQSS